ncbi:MAG: cobalamin-dependent protein [Actinomycetia bacterium]|nr:cobalamin-dependent protein [Actinomycetes bacterium]
MIKKVLLIQPPYTIHKADPKGCQPPLGLAYLASVLENSGFEVKILDAIVDGFDTEISVGNNFIRYGLDFDKIQSASGEFAPDIIGISSLFSCQYSNALTVAEILKKDFPDSKIVMGGAHPSATCEEILKNECVDFVILGEGEYSFRDLIAALNSGQSLINIDGLAYKADGEIRVNPKTSFIQDLDKLPFPARHLLDMEKYFQINRPHGTTSKLTPNTSLIMSRGCPARCIFCSIHGIWGRKFRARSPENVVDEIEFLVKTYGIKELQFEDDNLTFDKERAVKIFQLMIERELGLEWTTPNGVAAYRLDDELIEAMQKSGCYRACLAIESGDSQVLHKIIKKPLQLEKVKPLVKKFRDVGIAVDGFFVVGFPGETREQIKRTFRFATQAGFDNVNFFFATPYKGTELYDLCEENKLLSSDFDYSRLKVGNAHISTTEFSTAELEKLVALETFKYRLRQLGSPRIFYERVFKRLLNDPRFFMSYFWRLVTRLVGVKRN